MSERDCAVGVLSFTQECSWLERQKRVRRNVGEGNIAQNTARRVFITFTFMATVKQKVLFRKKDVSTVNSSEGTLRWSLAGTPNRHDETVSEICYLDI